MNNQSTIEQCKKWVKDYELKFREKGLIEQSELYQKLGICIEFTESKKSVELVNHFYKLRNNIQINHINKGSFDKKYQRLNEKVVYHLNKMINQIWEVDYMIGNQQYRLHIFKSDIPYWKEDLHKRNKL